MNLLRVKLKLFRATATAVMLSTVVGCSKGDCENLLGGVITFEPYDFKESVTRASMKSAFSTGDDFGSYVYTVTAGTEVTNESQPDLMNNTEVILGEMGMWDYNTDPKPCWPGADFDAQMICYTPFSDNTTSSISTSASGGYPIITYTMPESNDEQPDLMVATHKRRGDNISNVSLTFTHQLAAVAFQMRAPASTSLTSVALTGFYDRGDLQYDGTAWGWNASNKDEEEHSYYASIKSDLQLIESKPQLVTSDDGYLMVVPQSVPATGSVVVAYIDEFGRSQELTAPLPYGTSWTAGKKYLYTISIDMDIDVHLTIEVGDWSIYDTSDVIGDGMGFDIDSDDWDDNDSSDVVGDGMGFKIDVFEWASYSISDSVVK